MFPRGDEMEKGVLNEMKQHQVTNEKWTGRGSEKQLGLPVKPMNKEEIKTAIATIDSCDTG